MKYGEYLDQHAALTQAAARGNGRMEVSDAGQYLAGYLAPFGLRRPFSVWDARHGGAWVLPGLTEWWDRPGAPAVPYPELQRLESGRVNFILRTVLTRAVATDSLDRLITLHGQDRTRLLAITGLEERR